MDSQGREAPVVEGLPFEVGPSSRTSLAAAGWKCAQAGAYKRLLTKRDVPFSWLNPRPLWRSRNDRLARARWLGPDPTNHRRAAWVGPRWRESDLVVDRSSRSSTAFVVIGDTGEGDASQYAVVPGLLRAAQGTSFMFICSDLIYPAGGIAEYAERFYRPYEGYRQPIYAVPGNHDWYDDLTGFMFHLCHVDSAPAQPPPRFGSRAWLRHLLWRQPDVGDGIEAARRLRAARGGSGQPGPYLAIDVGPLRLVGIDTGITNSLDRDQGEWLRRVSADSDRPKILLTGKPIYVDAKYEPGRIDGGGTVDEVVTDPRHNYIAAIGGDIHNYQRYPVRLPDGRTIQYVVSGGGGAFMHSTHQIPRVDLPGVSEDEFRCYPRRGDSLSIYSLIYDRKLRLGLGGWAIPPDEAATLMGERLHIEPARAPGPGHTVSDRSRRAAERVLPLHRNPHGPLHTPFSEFFDWNDPPLFKSFLRIDAGEGRVRICCLAATGCLEDEQRLPLEDVITAALGPDGRWVWTEAPA